MPPRYQDPPYSSTYRYTTRPTSPHRTRTRTRLDLVDNDTLAFASPLDAGIGLDRVGDYVARRLVPAVLGRSDRPLRLVMNFGTLHLADDGGQGRRGSAAGTGASNAVVYNAPGCVMTMGGGRMDGEAGYGYGYGAGVAVCERCFRRRGVGSESGYCVECELDMGTGTGTRRGERAGIDGVRYGYAGEGSEWLTRDERDRETLREMDERLRELEWARKMRRERERRAAGTGGYYSDFEREEVRYGTGRDGGRYAGRRW